jgi:hypothetical protein
MRRTEQANTPQQNKKTPICKDWSLKKGGEPSLRTHRTKTKKLQSVKIGV